MIKIHKVEKKEEEKKGSGLSLGGMMNFYRGVFAKFKGNKNEEEKGE